MFQVDLMFAFYKHGRYIWTSAVLCGALWLKKNGMVLKNYEEEVDIIGININ